METTDAACDSKSRTASKREWAELSKRARGRRKVSRQALQEESRVLETQLAALRDRRLGHGRRPDSLGYCQDAINQEWGARRAAQFRNTLLHNSLKAVANDSYKIRKLLRTSLKLFRGLQSDRPPICSLEYEPHIDDPAFETLERREDRHYREMEHAFQAAGITEASTGLSRIEGAENDAGQPFIRVAYDLLAPFAPDTITHGILQFNEQHVVVCSVNHSQLTPCLSTTRWLKMRYILHDRTTDERAMLVTRGIHTVRRTSEGSVITWVAKGTVDQLLGAIQGIETQEQTWMAIKKHSQHGASPVTRVQLCFQTTPTLSAASSPSVAQFKRLCSQTVFPCIEEALQATRQGMENCFCDEHRRREQLAV